MKNPPEVIGKDALVGFTERGNSLDLLDLEMALAVLPVADRYIKRIMEVRGRASLIVIESLKADGAKQRLYGSTAFGLKDGTWTMAEWEAIALRDFLLTYVGKDFSEADLDKAIHFEDVEIEAACPDHGPFRQKPVCGECGQIAVRLVVSHTGINAIEKAGSAAVKEAIGKHRRRSEPSLTMKTIE